jgi:hypothetical protein
MVPAADQALIHGIDHFGLLSDARVYARIKRWLSDA